MNNDVIKICEKDSVHRPYITELKLMNVSDPRSSFSAAQATGKKARKIQS